MAAKYDMDALEKCVKNKAVFLSGPMTGIENNNAAAFAEAHALMIQAGAAEVYDPVQRWFNNGAEERTHEAWMRESIRVLAGDSGWPSRPRWDVMVQLDGWNVSQGALTEDTVARACMVAVVELREFEIGEESR